MSDKIKWMLEEIEAEGLDISEKDINFILNSDDPYETSEGEATGIDPTHVDFVDELDDEWRRMHSL